MSLIDHDHYQGGLDVLGGDVIGLSSDAQNILTTLRSLSFPHYTDPRKSEVNAAIDHVYLAMLRAANRAAGVSSSSGQVATNMRRGARSNVLMGAVTIPTAGADYIDYKTVLAVQAALKAHGFNPGTLDGKMGPNTAKAIRAMQSSISIPMTGVIDEGVIEALGVTPGVLPPGVSAAAKAQVEAQAALDAATAVEHAETPSDVQAAADQVVAAAPAQPPELKAAAVAAANKAKAAKTPAAVEAAKTEVQQAAKQVVSATGPWYGRNVPGVNRPLWQVGLAGVGVFAIGGGLYSLFRSK
jgi:peptidoglycan hydrolase-like protein with peptidoglycan-binding domain